MQAASPQLKPGQRIVAGKPYTYDMGLTNAHDAYERVLAAPALLDRLTYEDVGLLVTSAASVIYDGHTLPYPVDIDLARLLHKRACEERAMRPEHRRAFGGSGVSKREAA